MSARVKPRSYTLEEALAVKLPGFDWLFRNDGDDVLCHITAADWLPSFTYGEAALSEGAKDPTLIRDPQHAWGRGPTMAKALEHAVANLNEARAR